MPFFDFFSILSTAIFTFSTIQFSQFMFNKNQTAISTPLNSKQMYASTASTFSLVIGGFALFWIVMSLASFVIPQGNQPNGMFQSSYLTCNGYGNNYGSAPAPTTKTKEEISECINILDKENTTTQSANQKMGLISSVTAFVIASVSWFFHTKMLKDEEVKE